MFQTKSTTAQSVTVEDAEDEEDVDDARLRDVICTAEIGLQRTAVRDGADVILKPKVILAAVLHQDW